MKIRIILLSILLITAAAVQAQQLPLFSQYMYNRVAINPAIAGTNEYIDFKLNHRSQWVGFDDAPVTQVLNGHGILPNGNMGVGGYIFNDQAGPFRRLGVNLAYSYHIQLGDMNMSFGLSAGMMQYSVDGNKMDLFDATDNAIDLTTRDKDWVPDANFGLNLYNDKMYLGVSALHLIQGQAEFFEGNNLSGSVPLEHHYYVMGGYDAEINDNVTLEPSVLVHVVEANPTQLHLNLNATFNQMIHAGFSYRTGDAMAILAGATFDESIFVMYSYDILYSGLKNSNSGSHEITLGYHLPYRTGDGPLKKRYKLNKVRVE